MTTRPERPESTARFEFKDGCMCEDYPWEIQTDYYCCEYVARPCKHCHSSELRRTTRSDGTYFDTKYWTCPVVVIAKNEGNCDMTAVCLQCILEALATADVAEAVKKAISIGKGKTPC